MKLTQSILSSAEDCQIKAQFTLDPPPWAKRVAGSSRALGTAFHAGLAIRYESRMKAEDQSQWLVSGEGLATGDDMLGAAIEIFRTSQKMDLYDNTPIEVFKWDDSVPDEATAETFLAQMLAYYMENGHEWPFDWQVLGVEINETLTDARLGRVKLGADLILRAPDGGIVSVDHKTGRKPWAAGKADPRKNAQSPFYNRLVKVRYPGAPYYRFVFDIMVLPRPRAGIVMQRLISDPTEAHEEAIVQRALAFQQVYETVHVKMGLDLQANPASTLCNPQWCDHFEGCPYGRALEQPVV